MGTKNLVFVPVPPGFFLLTKKYLKGGFSTLFSQKTACPGGVSLHIFDFTDIK